MNPCTNSASLVCYLILQPNTTPRFRFPLSLECFQGRSCSGFWDTLGKFLGSIHPVAKVCSFLGWVHFSQKWTFTAATKTPSQRPAVKMLIFNITCWNLEQPQMFRTFIKTILGFAMISCFRIVSVCRMCGRFWSTDFWDKKKFGPRLWPVFTQLPKGLGHNHFLLAAGCVPNKKMGNQKRPSSVTPVSPFHLCFPTWS